MWGTGRWKAVRRPHNEERIVLVDVTVIDPKGDSHVAELVEVGRGGIKI